MLRTVRTLGPWLVALLLAVAAAASLATRLADRSAEVGERRRTTPDPQLVEALAQHPGPVFATLYLTRREAAPSALRALEPQLVSLCENLERATDGRFGFALVHPDASDDARAFATARGVGERRVRRIERDGWSEASVYSTLELSGADGRHALIEGLTTDDLDQLQRRMAAHLELLAEPARPAIALCAPEDGHAALARELARRGEVTRVTGLDDAAVATSDLVVWVAPTAERLAAGDAERAAALLERGASLVVAASQRVDRIALSEDDPGAPPLVVSTRADADLAPVWRALALEPLDADLLDETCVELGAPTDPDAAGAGEPTLRVPFVLRAIAPNQDFRRFAGQPNATLLFGSPQALALDETGLSERGWRAHVLATSSAKSYAPADDQDLATGVPVSELSRANGRALPKLPLLVELEPQDALTGHAVVAASARFVHDEFLVGDDAQPQRRALDLIVRALTADERLVAARGEYAGPPTFTAPTRTTEFGWRTAALLGVPALLVLVAFARRRALGAAGRTRSDTRPRGVALAAGSALAALLVLGPVARGVLAGAPPLPPALLERATACVDARGELRIELVAPATHRMPAEIRAAVRDAASRLRSLGARVDGASFARVDANALAPDHPGLALPLRTLTSSEGEVERARRVRTGLVVRAGDAEPIAIELEDARAFERLDFRLGHALWRATTGERARVGFAASTPRLSSAEAHMEFQRLQLFAPSGSDVFSAAREQLVRDGFEVLFVDQDAPATDAGFDALVWLQPRRDTSAMLGVLARHLADGGGALVAGQAHEVVARQLEGRDLETVYWPRPTNADLDQLWFEDIGARVPTELVFDELVFVDRAEVRSESDARGRVLSTQDRALAFQVRASSAAFAGDSPLAGARDLPWFGGNPIAFDRARLAERGLTARALATTGPEAWRYAWDGGYLDDAVLAGSGDAIERDGALPLVAEVTGRFPLADAAGRATDAVGAADGRLILAGSSALFANGRLGDARFGTRAALTSTVASLALPDDLAALARPRARANGLGAVDDDARVAWRTIGLAFAPLFALLLGLARFAALRIGRNGRVGGAA